MPGPFVIVRSASASPNRPEDSHEATDRELALARGSARRPVLIAWELHGIHGDMMLPVDEQFTATAPDSDLQNSLDDLSDDVATLSAKVDAMMMAMMQLRR